MEGSTLYESVLNGDKVTILGSGEEQRDCFLKQNVFESKYINLSVEKLLVKQDKANGLLSNTDFVTDSDLD